MNEQTYNSIEKLTVLHPEIVVDPYSSFVFSGRPKSGKAEPKIFFLYFAYNEPIVSECFIL